MNSTVPLNENVSVPSEDYSPDSPVWGAWKIFENKKYNYTISYPEKTPFVNKYFGDSDEDRLRNTTTRIGSNTFMTEPELADSIVIGWGPDSLFRVEFAENPEKFSLIDFIEKNEIKQSLTREVIERDGRYIDIQGKKAFEFQTDLCCVSRMGFFRNIGRYIYIQYDTDTIIAFHYLLTNDLDEHGQEHAKIFETMFNSLRFK